MADNGSEERVVYLSGRKPKKPHRKLKIFNICLIFLFVYFSFSIVSQQFKLNEIENQTLAVEQELNTLTQEEYLLTEELNATGTQESHMAIIRNILGYVEEGETKVIKAEN